MRVSDSRRAAPMYTCSLHCTSKNTPFYDECVFLRADMAMLTQLHETTKVEEVEARRCKARLEHLVSIGLPQKDEATKWNDKRMDRILADYMLRRGYHRSATQLARERSIEVHYPARNSTATTS